MILTALILAGPGGPGADDRGSDRGGRAAEVSGREPDTNRETTMAKRSKKAEQAAPEGVVEMSVNGHSLSGACVGGKWRWTCPSWPEMAERHSGDASTGPMLEEYMRACLAGSVRVLAEGN